MSSRRTSPSFGQYVSSVGLCSSEYGCRVYSASNLVCRPTLYPTYGDDPSVYSLQEYGLWWQQCPAAAPPLPACRPPRPLALAFIDVHFLVNVYPERMEIFETQQSGTVVRVWGRESGRQGWWLLWEGEASTEHSDVSRRLALPMKSVNALFSLFRLELDYSRHSYHSCLDAILLTGRAPVPPAVPTCPRLPYLADCSDECPCSTDDGDDVSPGTCADEQHGSRADGINVSVEEPVTAGCGPASQQSSFDVDCSSSISGDDESVELSECGYREPRPSYLDYYPYYANMTYISFTNKATVQAPLRTHADILADGPHQIASMRITDLVSIFHGSDSYPPDLRADAAQRHGHAADGRRAASRTDAAQRHPPAADDCQRHAPAADNHRAGADAAQHRIAGASEEDCRTGGGGYFQKLPPELLLRILSMLDLRSLCRVGQTCRLLNQLAYHHHLYTHITLKDWWMVVDNRALLGLMARLCRDSGATTSSHRATSDDTTTGTNSRRSSGASDWGMAAVLQAPPDTVDQHAAVGWTAGGSERSNDQQEDNVERVGSSEVRERASRGLVALDLSWCGSYGAIDSTTFLKFISGCGEHLRILRLSCCDFVDNYCLYIIANVCVHLTELNLSRCYALDFLGLGELKMLDLLTRLDLSHTKLANETVHVMLQHTRLLRHLALSGCLEVDMDEACVALADFCPQLVTLTAWKAQGLSSRGLKALARLPLLQDLDLGWAFSPGVSLGGSLVELVENCQGLVRLRLTACRNLTDGDVAAIARCCGQLQQLDVMGNTILSPDPLHSVLQSCPALRVMDVSYCNRISRAVVDMWRPLYPAVTIHAGEPGAETYGGN